MPVRTDAHLSERRTIAGRKPGGPRGGGRRPGKSLGKAQWAKPEPALALKKDNFINEGESASQMSGVRHQSRHTPGKFQSCVCFTEL